MRRRLLNLCLRAYPRATRERDRDYLRDLALEMSERYGVRRQALSLLRGGLAQRIESRPLERGASPLVWMKRVVIVCFALAATALAAGELTGGARGGEVRVESERLECVRPVHVGGGRGCAGTSRLIAARVRAGWECEMRRRLEDGRRLIEWRCALRQPVSRSAL